MGADLVNDHTVLSPASRRAIFAPQRREATAQPPERPRRLIGFATPTSRQLPVATDALPRLQLYGAGVPNVRWQGVFVAYSGRGADQTTTIVFEIAPGNRLGWRTDQTEETQDIVAGTGELRRDDATFPVGPGSEFVLPTNVRHDLINTGTEILRCIAFFGATMFTQKFDELMQPVGSHVLGTPNRDG